MQIPWALEAMLNRLWVSVVHLLCARPVPGPGDTMMNGHGSHFPFTQLTVEREVTDRER